MKIYPDLTIFLGSQNKIATSKIVPSREVVMRYHHSDISEKHLIPNRTGQYNSYNEIVKKKHENKRNDILARFVIGECASVAMSTTYRLSARPLTP